MVVVWLFVHFNIRDFDVRVEGTYLYHLIGLFANLLEESLKQNV